MMDFWRDHPVLRGVVTKAFMVGGSVSDADEQEAAIHYTKSLTFQVPDTDECRTPEIEIEGEFRESADANGEWATVLEMHPRDAYQRGRPVGNR
jgi:hypothetical protein